MCVLPSSFQVYMQFSGIFLDCCMMRTWQLSCLLKDVACVLSKIWYLFVALHVQPRSVSIFLPFSPFFPPIQHQVCQVMHFSQHDTWTIFGLALLIRSTYENIEIEIQFLPMISFIPELF